MVIRPTAAAYVMGEIGRSAAAQGVKGGPAAFFTTKDEVALSRKVPQGLGLYSATPLFKIMGAVELMSEELELTDDGLAVGSF